MAEQLLDQVRDAAEGQIDFEGQKLAENLSNYLLGLVGAIAFLVGYIRQDIILALYLALGGGLLVMLIVVPAWPFFNKHPVKWLPIRGGVQITVPQNLVIDEKAIR